MKSFLIILSFLLCSVSIADGTNFVILAHKIPNLVEENGKGAYQLIMREAARNGGVAFKEEFYPSKRALKMVYNKEALCIYIFSNDAEKELGKDKVITSPAIGMGALYIFTLKGVKPFSSIDELKGKTISGTLGAEGYYESLVKKNINIDYATTNEQNIKKLKMGRVDAILGFLPDLNMHLHELSYNPEFTLLKFTDRVTCHNNKEGRKFLKAIAPAIEEMKKNGRVKELRGEFYFEFK